MQSQITHKNKLLQCIIRHSVFNFKLFINKVIRNKLKKYNNIKIINNI